MDNSSQKKPEKENPTLVQNDKESSAKRPNQSFHWTFKSFFFSFAWLFLLLLIADLVSKWVIVNTVGVHAQTILNPDGSISTQGGAVTLIPGFLYIIGTVNPGSAYSFGANLPWMRYVFIAISWIASLAIIYYWYTQLKKNDYLINSVFMLCLAGALGNAIDRTFYWNETTGFSGVVDWIQFYLFKGLDNLYPFPTFNIADSCLTIGVVMALVILIVRDIKAHKQGGQ